MPSFFSRTALRILVVGSRWGNEILVGALRGRGFDVETTRSLRVPDPLQLGRFDLIYGTHLQTCARSVVAGAILGKRTIIHFVGGDAYRYQAEQGLRKRFWKFAVQVASRIFYVSPHLAEIVGREGVTLPYPIETSQFRPNGNKPVRDVLYYCPGGEANARTYRRDWIENYGKEHPDQKITVVGNPMFPAEAFPFAVPNIETIPYVEYKKMPQLYSQHRQLIRMTTHNGLPRMVDEAILCGLEVTFNGKAVKEVAAERDPEVFAKKFEEIIADT